MKNIAVFGGTFNPPHLAHKRLIDEMNKAVGFDKVLIIPTYVPPHKTAPDLASCQDRLEMCRRTFFEKYYTVSDMEISRGGKSYSYDTFCSLKKEYPAAKLHLVIGSDMLLSFDKWYRYEDILSMATLCVATRQNDIRSEKLALFATERLHLNCEKGEIIILPAQAFELSSTQIRQLIKDKKDVSPFLEKETLQYIKEEGLYR